MLRRSTQEHPKDITGVENKVNKKCSKILRKLLNSVIWKKRTVPEVCSTGKEFGVDQLSKEKAGIVEKYMQMLARDWSVALPIMGQRGQERDDKRVSGKGEQRGGRCQEIHLD